MLQILTRFCFTPTQLIFSGEYTKAMSKDWHSGHFCCWQCDESLTGQRYVLRDEHPYCIKCYENVFANVCEECNKTIGIDSKVRLQIPTHNLLQQLRGRLRSTKLTFTHLSFPVVPSFSPGLRISRTRISTGTRRASCATNAASRWWTNSSARRRTRSTAATATMPSLLRAAMVAVKSSVQVGRVH